MEGGIWQKRSCPGVGPSRSLFSRAKWQKTVPKVKNERGWSGFKAAMICFWRADGQETSLGTTTPGLSEIPVASWWQRQIPWGQRFWGEWPLTSFMSSLRPARAQGASGSGKSDTGLGSRGTRALQAGQQHSSHWWQKGYCPFFGVLITISKMFLFSFFILFVSICTSSFQFWVIWVTNTVGGCLQKPTLSNRLLGKQFILYLCYVCTCFHSGIFVCLLSWWSFSILCIPFLMPQEGMMILPWDRGVVGRRTGLSIIIIIILLVAFVTAP